MKTQLVGVIKGPTLAAAKEQMEGAAAADILEIRLDLLESKVLNHLDQLPKTKPLIFTFRKKSQGGARDLSEQERLTLFKKCLSARPQYCDIETDTDHTFFEEVGHQHPEIKIIGSLHNFNGMPANLLETFEHMHKPQIALYKMAFMVHSTNEALRLMAFAKGQPKLTCIAMGDEGQVSRILAPVMGFDLCYASIDETDSPLGQLSLKTLCDTYRFKTLTKETQIYALLGSPVSKSVGHVFHNKSFPKDSVYVKLCTTIPDLPFFFSIVRKFPFKGFSITMPIKEQLGNYLTRIDPASAMIGSVNTIVVQDEHLIGFNTDGAGAMNALEHHAKVAGKRILILGAGGSARAIAYEALQRKAHVIVLNRTLARAQALAKDFGCESGSLEDFSTTKYDVLINTVPVDLIFDPTSFVSSAIVMDIVYWETETPLLKAAHERGCVCINGYEMFKEQALLQQKLWFAQ